MFKFFAGSFAIAGLIAASGPIIIHLLNRRRFRVVDWAAMDFLRQAMQRSRRAVQLRELLVLVPQQQASLALITRSTAPINIGDTVQASKPQ